MCTEKSGADKHIPGNGNDRMQISSTTTTTTTTTIPHLLINVRP